MKKLIDRSYGVVAVDFDATISMYDGWRGPGVFGLPLPGCKEALDELMEKGYTIIINTTRGVDIEQVRDFLIANDIPFCHINENSGSAPPNVGDKKVLADVYIDDRSMQFGGRWQGMVEQVEQFVPWWQRVNKRPSLNLAIGGYYVDQVSLYVLDIEESRQRYSDLGHSEWVNDRVRAQVFGCEILPASIGIEFVVDLSFNYTIYPCEFELIKVVEGSTVQIPDDPTTPGLSHYGFHVDDIITAMHKFNACGYPMMTHVKTLEHSGCPHNYEYAFMDSRKLGFISKLICRADKGGD